MKITIDTKEKTIELHESVSVSELEQMVRSFNLTDYTILMEKVKPTSHPFPIPREGNGFTTFIDNYKNIGPDTLSYPKNIPIGRNFIYSDGAPHCELKTDKKQLLKG